MMKVKVCGMKYSDNIVEIASLLPDYIGFIFWKPSARYFDGALPQIPASVNKVGVFVDNELENIISKIEKYKLDCVQLHGKESPEFCAQIKTLNTEVIKAFSIDDNVDFSHIETYENACDYFLFDTKGKLPGGNGASFNWKILQKFESKKPFFLSGGIGLDEIEKIKKLQLPIFGIDLNSKFETKPGLKAVELVKKAIKTIRYNKMNYTADENGFYCEFGGAYIPEMLFSKVEKLKENYLKIIEQPAFKAEYQQLLKDYVGRPTPLYFSKKLSKKHNAKIYLKREDLCHTGAHKINNAIGQILLAKHLGKKRIIAETGAGQHGVATATVCALMGLECVVYMGEIDIKRQAPNVARMKMLGAEVRPALSGSKTLKDATNEAIRDWINNPDTYYLIGSVVGPHPYPDMVSRFLSVISEEIKSQLLENEKTENPDYVIACVGGGSNAAGAFYHFLDNDKVKLIAAEAAGMGISSGKSAATTVLGKTGILHGSKTLLMQTDDGQITEPYSISAGLDYPGIGPMHANLFFSKRAQFIAITDAEAMHAGFDLSRSEGIVPAIESAHALAVLHKMTFKSSDIIVINLSGRGDKDLETYNTYFKISQS